MQMQKATTTVRDLQLTRASRLGKKHFLKTKLFFYQTPYNANGQMCEQSWQIRAWQNLVTQQKEEEGGELDDSPATAGSFSCWVPQVPETLVGTGNK